MTARLRNVALLGATGLVGRELLKALAADDSVGRVLVLARREAALPSGVRPADAAKVDQRIVDFERLEERPELLAVEQVYCALGTTIRKAGSQASFRRVDHDYPITAARIARRQGANHFLLVSALGADPDSRIFYNRVKGEVERDVCALGYPSVTIVRPSLLLGDRGEFRLGEEIGKRLAFLAPRRWAPVQAAAVARALVAAGREDRPGARVIESAAIGRARSSP